MISIVILLLLLAALLLFIAAATTWFLPHNARLLALGLACLTLEELIRAIASGGVHP